MKKIRFDLPIDGTKVSGIVQLREHFTTEIIVHFRKGVLESWLEPRGEDTLLGEVKELKRIDSIRPDDAIALRELCRIFKVDADGATIEAAVAQPTGIPGRRLRTQKEFLKWFVATTHYLSRLVSPRSGIPDFRRVHLGFGLPDAPASADPNEWSAYVVEFINHCQVVIEVLKSCPDRAFAETLAGHLSDHVDRVLHCFDGMTRDEYEVVPIGVHVEAADPPIRMEPLRHDVRTSSRTRITDLRWSSTGVIDKAGAVDWWCFTVLHRGKVTVETTGALDTIGALDAQSGYRIALSGDSDPTRWPAMWSGHRIAHDDDSGRGGNFRIVHTLDPGTYYIRVSAHGVETGSYTLHVRHTQSSRSGAGDDPTRSAATIGVNQSVSRATAMADRHRQEALRGLSKENLRELEGIAGVLDSSGAGLVRAWPIIQRSLNENPRASEDAADGDSAGGPSVLGILELAARGIAGTATPGIAGALAGALSDSARRRLTDEQQMALQAFGDAIHENGAQLVRRIRDTGLLPSRSDSGMHDET